jgi:hypothetical protein
MLVLTCSSALIPCPYADQVWIDIAALLDLSVLGVTPASVLETFGFGCGAVLSLWVVGYAVGVLVGTIRKI